MAKELRLDWETVKTLEKQYMEAQLARAGRPGPKAIGIDEVSTRKGHTYPPQGPHLHASRAMIAPDHPLDSLKTQNS